MSRTVQQQLAQSGIAFGTSGARGLVSAFNDDNCGAFTQAFIEVMRQGFQFDRIALGIDNRPSSVSMAAACAGMAQACGVQVDYYGVLPTPALACKAMQDQVPAIMVTGSHIPFDRNGLKFYRPDGEISKADELAILAVTSAPVAFSPAVLQLSPAAADAYLARYLDLFPAHCLQGKHIGVYEHSSAGRDLYRQVFEALGAQVTTLDRTDTFVPIDTEAVADSDKQKAKAWADEFAFDAIFSTDGDGDRPLIADEKGQWLRGDMVGLLCAKTLGIQQLAVPVSCNTAIEASGAFARVVRTKIGSPYVIAAFDAWAGSSEPYAGFEANGGFILGSDVAFLGGHLAALPTRDALLPGLALLFAAGSHPLSALCADLPQRFTASDRLQQVPVAQSQALLQAAAADPAWLLAQLGLADLQVLAQDLTDGLRLTLSGGDIVHLRPSGNAPELRCYVECETEAMAVALVAQVLTGLKQQLG
ncbi:phosphomannomutase [Rheinheimera marina]|uniref:Phosphomannomutase n=1 Tax=Rheinheimera marina TaxID=1774958 RepID=A0ABV9JR99_9GAMM